MQLEFCELESVELSHDKEQQYKKMKQVSQYKTKESYDDIFTDFNQN